MTLNRDDVVLDETQREGMLDVIAGESERLARIVNDILLASRLDSGSPTSDRTCDARRDRTRGARGRRDAPRRRRSRAWPRPSRCPPSPQTPTGSARCSSTSSRTPSSIRPTAARRARAGAARRHACVSSVATAASASRRPSSERDLREVLPPRPEPHPRRGRHRARALHLPRDRAAHGWPDLARVRGRPGLDVPVRAARRAERRTERGGPAGRLVVHRSCSAGLDRSPAGRRRRTSCGGGSQ